MPFYEIRVAGPIGPVVASMFPGFTITASPASTAVNGTFNDIEDLLAFLNLMHLHGFALFDTAEGTDQLGE